MDYRNAHRPTFDELGPNTPGFSYADLDADELDYYSTSNPRYGRTESFAPPRPFAPSSEQRGAGRARSASRPGPASRGPRERRDAASTPRAFAREPLRISDKLKSFACIALALVILLLMGSGLLRASGQEGPLSTLSGSSQAFGRGESAAEAVGTAQHALDEALAQIKSDESPASTPRDQWARGTMPHLYQKDPQWADTPYADSTMGVAGCGPTCLSMAYIYLTGDTSYDPVAMARFATEMGYIDSGATLWLFMSEGARQLGLQSEELGADPSQIAQALEAGNPVIAIVGPGDFTNEGHFIVMHGLDAQGDAVVYDPNSPSRSATPWDISTIVGQALCFWELSV